jgi:glutathione S-transferase
MARTRLYVIPASHPSVTAGLMLERKGIEYHRVDLMPALHKPILRALGFKGVTVPALKLRGERVQGSRAIARKLDEVRPEPPLFPSDAAQRAAVEDAERWGDEVLQPAARRLSWWLLRRDRSTIGTFLEGSRIGIPHGLAVRTAAPIVWASARINRASDESARADLAALPEMLDRIDGWIAAGVIGGPAPNAADYQIATSVRLLLCLDDLAPAIRDRPAGELAMRVVPDYSGHVPAIAPPELLEPVRRTTPQPRAATAESRKA